ncbi:hypothetical protein ACFWVC_37890, partial [Streptomyces sp. NPDC058691]
VLVSILCQGEARANSSTDLDGDLLERAAIAQHFVFLMEEFNVIEFASRVHHPDLIVTYGEGCASATLNPEVWFS